MQGTHDVRKWGYQDANVFFVDGSKYTVCKMLDEEAIAIYLQRKPHTFWTRPPKNRDKQFFSLVGMKVHFSGETNIACRRQS